MAWELSMVGAAIVGFTVVVRNCTGAARDLIELGASPAPSADQPVGTDSDRRVQVNRADEIAKARRRHQTKMWQAIGGAALSLFAVASLFFAERSAELARVNAERATELARAQAEEEKRLAEDNLKQAQQTPPIEPKAETSVMVRGDLPEIQIAPDPKYLDAIGVAAGEFRRILTKPKPITLDENDLKSIRAALEKAVSALGSERRQQRGPGGRRPN